MESSFAAAFEILSFGAIIILVVLGLGIIGSYVWRAYENTKARPLAVVMRDQAFCASPTHRGLERPERELAAQREAQRAR